jgi:hypothetical protein
MSWRRFARIVVLAFVFGIVAGILAGQSGDGVGLASRVRSVLGGLSAPWVLLAWVAGARTSRVVVGAVLGVGTTIVALVGFYVVSGIVEPMGGRTLVQDVGSWIAANRVWFEAGVVSGPIFGALGGWWRRRGSPPAILVAGALLAGEPVVLWVTGALFPNGVLSPLTGLPLVVRVVPGFGLSHADGVSIAVHAVELVAGLALGVLGLRRRRAVAPSSSPA